MLCQSCSQRPAMYQLGNGTLLCLSCAYQHTQMINSQQRSMERMINFLMDEMDMAVGFGVRGPRFPEPAPPVVQQQPTNVLHNVSIDRSVVGAVNSGTIQSLNQNMSNVSNSVNEDVAKIIKLVVEKILALNELKEKKRQEFIEKVDFLTEQIATSAPKRKLSMVKETLDWISRLFTTYEASGKIWLLAQAVFKKLIKGS